MTVKYYFDDLISNQKDVADVDVYMETSIGLSPMCADTNVFKIDRQVWC